MQRFSTVSGSSSSGGVKPSMRFCGTPSKAFTPIMRTPPREFAKRGNHLRQCASHIVVKGSFVFDPNSLIELSAKCPDIRSILRCGPEKHDSLQERFPTSASSDER